MGRSSCCTSSEYCYHTDSTSLYGSRSSLSRNNSIKSASAILKTKRTHLKEPYYSSMSLAKLNYSNSNSLIGSLTSIHDQPRDFGRGKMILSPSKVTIERQSNAINRDLPEYACSPSPIRWSFLDDSESKTPSDFESATIIESNSEKKKESDNQLKDKYDFSLYRGLDKEESTTVVFSQEGEAFNNCCNNYFQCNAFLDHNLQITNEDICEYLSKGNQGNVLNNSITYPIQPSNNLEFRYKNNFKMSNNNTPNLRRSFNKDTNLNQNNIEILPSVDIDTTMSPANINLSSSSNNINIIFNTHLGYNENEVKFINTSRDNDLSREDHYSTYFPFNHPSYNYTNMSTNSLFDKPLGIDEIPSSNEIYEGSSHIISDSFDTSASSHNLLFYRYSSDHNSQHNFELSSSSSFSCSHNHPHSTRSKWQYISNNFIFRNALRKVQRHTEKFTQYLSKK